MQRELGFESALRACNLPVREEFVIPGDFTFRGGSEAMAKLLALEDKPTAVFVLNDMMAIGAISTARRLGYQVPADISILGFDDIELASAINPALTTMAQPKQELAEIATSRLIEKMLSGNSDWENEQIILKANLIIRESTAAPKR